MDGSESAVTVRFSGAVTAEGDGYLALFPPGLDVRAELDGEGAVAGYVATLHFDDADRAADAVFRIAEACREMGVEPEFS